MDCTPYSIELPATFKADTWDGLTWTVSSVPDGETEFAAVLSSARFQLKDSDGAVALTLTSATSGQVTLNETAANAWSVTVEPRALGLDAGTYSWGLETTDADGIIKTRIGGTLQIIDDLVA